METPEKIPVTIAVWSQQRQKNGERQTFQTKTSGTLYPKGDAWYVVYKEEEAVGLGSTLTTVRIENRTVTLIRQGETTMRQVLVKGEEQHGTYKTPYGTFDLTTRASHLVSRIDRQGGKLEVTYNIRLAGEKSRIELRMDVLPVS